MELPISELLTYKSFKYIKGQTLKDYPPKNDIIGQKRAIEALKAGFGINKSGYHFFVVGLPGLGKTYAIKKFLSALKPKICPVLWDYAYVYNFRNPDSPLLLVFPKGQAVSFREYLYEFIRKLKIELPKLFDSEVFTVQYQEVLKKAQEGEKKILQPFEEELRKNGFVLLMAKVGEIITPKILPLIDGKPVTFEKLEKYVFEGKLKKEEVEKVKDIAASYEPQLNKIILALRDLSRSTEEELTALEQTFATGIINDFSQELMKKFSISKIHIYLGMLKEYIVKNLRKFLNPKYAEDDIATEFKVNVILDSSNREDCPVYVEENPSWTTLFGTIEFDFTLNQAIRTDFTKIKGGSLLKADRGFLVINAYDLFEYPYVYQHLKRTLKYQKLEIVPPPFSYFTWWGLKPEPIDIDLKVILIGDEYHYNILYNYDNEFKEIFRIKAHFNDRIEVSPKNVSDFIGALSQITNRENLMSISKDGLQRLLFLSHRFCEDKKYLSLLFKNFYEILVEANLLATQDNSSLIEGRHIITAYKNRLYRHSLYEEEIYKLIKEKVIHINFDGEKVGEINGVSVVYLSDHIFAHPSRITVNVSVGKLGVVNIEREVGMSGRIHSKAVLILESFIREHFAKDFPLSINAKICFEQLYSGVEGDSATVAETLALISAISNQPIRQNFVVTGSMDQKGNVLSVGGITEKVEGVIKVSQLLRKSNISILLPYANRDNIILLDEIVEYMRKNRCKIYLIKTIDDALNIVFGKNCKTVLERTVSNLKQFATKLKGYQSN